MRILPRATVLAVALFVSPVAASEVLVYYANETSPEGVEAENYERIIGWLRSGGEHETADQLEHDRRLFPAAVDLEVHDLLLEGTQAAIFTNRLVRQGKCRIWKNGWQEVEFPAPADENYILAANPLSRPETFRDVLAFVARQFGPREYILVTKSHGSGEKALTPRLAVRSEETTREELLRVASGEGDAPWVGKLGISKEEYLSILEAAPMRFSLVFLEACNAASPEMGRLPENVDRLLLMREDAHYINLLWADILKSEGTLSEAILRDLPPKFVVLGESRLPLWVYFLPLVGWIGWLVWQWRPRARRRDRKPNVG